jgi:hypothetical protein
MTDDTQPATDAAARRRRTRTIASAVAVGAAGVVAGGVLAGTLSANAADDASGTATDGDHGQFGNGNTDPSKPMRSDEKLLTGATKAKVLAAVQAKYPDATIQRVETDSDGVYEAHVVNAGTPMIVQVGKDFTITGTQTGGHGGDHDGDGPGGAEAPAA